MPSYVLSNKAVEDLATIWNFTAEHWSETQADKYYFKILKCCNELAEQKLRGKNYSNIWEGLFGFKLQNHIIFFMKTSPTNIEIIRILHQRMDYRNNFK